MFHIKTDIRQYKCETAEKVERLIRNWVIRPSDLIYNSAEKTWNPIGQHPAFDDIFAGIEQEEANEPDTIVTEAPSEVAAEHEVEPGAELEADGGSPGDEETTDVRPAPSEASGASATNGASADAVATPSIVIDADNAMLAADSEEITNVTEAPGEPEAPDDEITDVREDPRRDTDEQDAAVVPTPPEPSDDVEGLIRDSDEITMMTDKTFEMLSEESGKKDSKAEADVEADAAPADPASGEPAADPKGELDGDAADELAVARDDEAASAEGLAEDSEPSKSSGGGRHGLPEEVFVTDEIPRQDVQQAVLDELGELEEDADPVDEDDEVTEVIDRDADGDDGDERKSRWRIVMSDDIDEDEALEDEPADDEDEPADDEPIDDEPIDEVEAGVDPHSDTAEAEPLGDDTPLEDAAEEIEAPSAEEVDEDDDLDDMLDEAAELVGLGEGTDPVDIDGGALEPVAGDEEGNDGEDQESRQRADTPVRAVVEPKEFISEGYNLPLPVDISPSKEDIRLGLEHSRVGRAIKDATFPYPQPKKRDQVSIRRFDLDPEDPADHSMLIVAAFVMGLLIIVLGAVTLLG